MMIIQDRRVVGVVSIVVILTLAYFLMPTLLKSEEAEKEAAFQSIVECLNVEKRNSCFKTLSQEFIEEGNLETVFSLLEENQQTPRIFESCHVLLHFVGQAAYKKIGDISDTLKRGNYVCFAGFYHGALEGYFIENNLLASDNGGLAALREKIPEICVEVDSEIKKDYFECLHGLGHGLMFATDGELPQALELCDALGAQSKANWCYSGAFMENSTSTTNPDHQSKYIRADDPFYPCNILGEKYLNTCYILQSMHVTQKTQANWAKVAGFCLGAPVNQRGACMNGIGQSLVGWSTDPNLVRDNCLMTPIQYQNDCIAGAVGGTGEKYKPPFQLISDLCLAFSGESQAFCYEAAFRSMNNWALNKRELEDFCSTIISAPLRKTCTERIHI